MTYYIYDEKGKKVGELPNNEMEPNQGCTGCLNLIIIIAIFIWIYKGCQSQEILQKQVDKLEHESEIME